MAIINMRKCILHYIKDDRGAATSLIEVTLVISIVAILAAAALSASSDSFQPAQTAHAKADTKAIAVAIHSFMQDTGLAPAFKSGTVHGPNDGVYLTLTTSSGSDPLIDASLGWSTDKADQDLIENQLIKNRPGDDNNNRYLRIGENPFDRFKGWNGPYLAQVPDSDPWDDKYFVTVQWLTPKGVTMGTTKIGSKDPLLTLATGQRAAAFVISAGPNRKIETQFAQSTDAFAASGDDIVYRIQ